jgi:hypothetical protein
MAATSAAMTMFVGHSWGRTSDCPIGAGGAGYCEAAANGVSSLRMILPPFITNFTR